MHYGLVSTAHTEHLKNGATEIATRFGLDANYPKANHVAIVQDAATKDDEVKAAWHEVLSTAPTVV
jgi:hypothetical protein